MSPETETVPLQRHGDPVRHAAAPLPFPLEMPVRSMPENPRESAGFPGAAIEKRLDDLYRASAIVALSPGDRLVVFSDLHLGDGGPRDDFRANGDLMARILRGPRKDADASLLEALRLAYGADTLFLFHGHQATVFFERFNGLSGFLLKYVANTLGIRNFPVTPESRKRFWTEHRAYSFAKARRIVSLIGHTHHPLCAIGKRGVTAIELRNVFARIRLLA